MLQLLIDAPPGKYPLSARGHAYFQLAGFKQSEGRSEEAVELLRKACEPSPDQQLMRSARLGLANQLILLGRAADAQPIIHDGLIWPGVPHSAGDLQEAMMRCCLAQGADKLALRMRQNIDKYGLVTPHQFNLGLLTITTYARLKDPVDTKVAVDALCSASSPVFDSDEISQFDKNLCTESLKSAGLTQLLSQLRNHFPGWDNSES
jgi:hypothetical protein